MAPLSPLELAWSQALPEQRRRQYRLSRAAMRQLLAPLVGLTPAQLPLHSPPGQAPVLAAGLGWVSLSHTADALLIAWSQQPLGVDLERADRQLDGAALLQRFFPERERHQLAQLAAEPLRQAVLRSWLVKEAAIKWRQRSLALELGSWCFDHQAGTLHHAGDGTRLCPREGAHGPWRWAMVGENLGHLQAGPLVWRFDCP